MHLNALLYYALVLNSLITQNTREPLISLIILIQQRRFEALKYCYTVYYLLLGEL